jgi:parvulin-like peptidyl-prolyl isomerase
MPGVTPKPSKSGGCAFATRKLDDQFQSIKKDFKMKRWLLVLSVVCAAALSSGLSAQDAGDSPVNLPPLAKNDVLVMPPEYPADLPTGEVSRIDDIVLTQADLLKQLLRTNLNAIADNLIQTKMCELELESKQLSVTDAECEEELAELMPRIAPGKTAQQVIDSGLFSRAYLMRTARTSRGWKKLFWAAKNIPEDQRTNQANQFLMQIYLNEVKGRFQISLRGQNPPPPKGALAALTTLVNGKKVSYVVTPEEAMEFMIGILRPATILQGQDKLIENRLVEREMQKAGAVVTDSEIEAWVRSMQEKFQPPFDWTTILRLKASSPDEERERWRHVQAWRRASKADVTQETIDAFRKENEDFFRSRMVKVSHILIKVADEATGLPKSPTAEADALARAQRIYELAREGVDFKKLAERYSEDDATAKNGGTLPQGLKKWGGGYDKAFQDAAYKLTTVGQITEPVRSALGFHVIICNEVTPATDREMDWKDERYADWVLEEFETIRMKAWKAELAAKSKIEKSDLAHLLDIKKVSFEKK